MSKVIEFVPKHADLTWECGCGCQAFYLSARRELECANCGETDLPFYLMDKEDEEE